MKHKYFLLGFSCCLLSVLTLLLVLIRIGHTERGSGRRELEDLFAAAQKQTLLLAYEGQAETKGDREPEKGNGRKD